MFEHIRRKVVNGERISDSDALFLYQSPELLKIGELADFVNRKKNRAAVFYNINRHINPTNICVMSCKFCAFAKKPGDEGAYAYTIKEIVEKASVAVEQGATEIHMVGGLHPRWKLSHYEEILSTLKEHFPSLHLKGFTAVEIDWLAKKTRISICDVLTRLNKAGLDSLPGGGAEVFHPDVREEITAKLSSEDWLNIHKTAHGMGMNSNCTMLYGHVEKYEHRVYHLSKLRSLQDETNGFNAFIPLSFQPHNNEMGIDRYTFGFDDLKNLAISRIYLDNFNHIKSYWIMMGQDIAQLGLYFGANDLDGTVIQEKISKMAGGRAGIHMAQSSLESIIRRTGRNPVERDTLYRPLPKETTEVVSDLDETKDLQGIFKEMTSYSSPSLEELLELANNKDIFQVGELASYLSKMHHKNSLSFAPSLDIRMKNLSSNEQFPLKVNEILNANLSLAKIPASLINLDLDGINKVDHCYLSFSGLVEILNTSKELYPNLPISISGVKGFWRLVQNANMSLGEAFKTLKKNGVKLFQGSRHESENGLTISEITNLHYAAHEQGLPTLAKIELSVPYRGDGPMWKNFFQKILAFRKIQTETSLLQGLCIIPAQDSIVSPAEFIRAISLARIAAPNISNITTTLLNYPVLSLSESRNKTDIKAQEKYASIAAIAGANDFGQIPIEILASESIFEEIISAGFKPFIRDAEFKKIEIPPWNSNNLRHIPKARSFP